LSEAEHLQDLMGDLSAGVVFSRRRDPIPGDLRLSWRLSMLCILLHKFWGSKTSLPCLHTMWWATRTSDTRELFLRWHEGRKRPDEILVRYDPSLTLTVDLAVGQELAAVSDAGAILLTPAGKRLAEKVWLEDEVLLAEKSFLLTLPTLSQRSLGELTEW
jgi:hypothetical protein